MASILIVEDDLLLNEGLAYALNKEGYTVYSARTYAEGIAWIAGRQEIGLILLDVRLPDGSGLALCERIRANSDVPIIYLTANDTEEDVVRGFQSGCDDYLAKPFSVSVLLQRIRAVLRRSNPEAAGKRSLICGNLAIDFDRMSVSKNGQPVKLTATEYKLLELLTRHQGQVLTREIILSRLWDSAGNFVDENALSVNIRRLRQKIEDDPKRPVYIKTVFGIGYTWGDGS